MRITDFFTYRILKKKPHCCTVSCNVFQGRIEGERMCTDMLVVACKSPTPDSTSDDFCLDFCFFSNACGLKRDGKSMDIATEMKLKLEKGGKVGNFSLIGGNVEGEQETGLTATTQGVEEYIYQEEEREETKEDEEIEDFEIFLTTIKPRSPKLKAKERKKEEIEEIAGTNAKPGKNNKTSQEEKKSEKLNEEETKIKETESGKQGKGEKREKDEESEESIKKEEDI